MTKNAYVHITQSLLLVVVAVLCAGCAGMQADNKPVTDPLMQRCESVLIEGLHGDEFWPSMHAAEALTLLGREELARNRLEQQLPETTDPQHRVGVARELVRAGDADKLTLIIDALKDELSNARVHAAETLLKLSEIGERQALLQTMTQTDDLNLRVFAAAALSRSEEDHEFALNALHESLKLKEDRPRRYAIFAAGLLADTASVDQLHKIIDRQDTEEIERLSCTQALARIGDAHARTLIEDQLTSQSPGTRANAALVVGEAGLQNLKPKLIELLDDSVADVRIRAAQGLILLEKER